MKLLQALIPEILDVSSVLMASIAMLVLMGWPYAPPYSAEEVIGLEGREQTALQSL